MALFDNLDDPQKLALMTMGLQLMAPTATRVGFGGQLANAGLLGAQTYGLAKRSQREDRANELQQVTGLYKTLKDIDQQSQQDALTGMGGPYVQNPYLGQLEQRIGTLTGMPSMARSPSMPSAPMTQPAPMPSTPAGGAPMPPSGNAAMPAQATSAQSPASQFQQMLSTAGISPAMASVWMRTPQGSGQLMKQLSEVYGPRTVNNVLMQLGPDGTTKILGGMMSQDSAPVVQGPNGPQVQPVTGAQQYFADKAGAVEQAQQQAKAKYDTITVPMPDGSTRTMTREQFVGGAKPASAPVAPGVASLTVTQPSKGMGVSQTPADQAQQTELSKFQAQTFIDTQQAGRSASGGLQKLDRIDQLMQGVDTGKLTPTGMQIAAYAQALGMPIDPKLPNKQAAEALTGQIALELRNPSGGAGMPGALSDNDLKFLRSMTPGLAQTTEGRNMIIETKRKIYQRDQEVAQLARDYRKSNNGKLDDGFQQTLADYSAQHPLFPMAQAPAGGGFKVLGKEP